MNSRASASSFSKKKPIPCPISRFQSPCSGEAVSTEDALQQLTAHRDLIPQSRCPPIEADEFSPRRKINCFHLTPSPLAPTVRVPLRHGLWLSLVERFVR